jgi:hypothetical protein
MRCHHRLNVLGTASQVMTGDSLSVLAEALVGRDDHQVDMLVNLGKTADSGEDTFTVPALEIHRRWALGVIHWESVAGHVV